MKDLNTLILSFGSKEVVWTALDGFNKLGIEFNKIIVIHNTVSTKEEKKNLNDSKKWYPDYNFEFVKTNLKDLTNKEENMFFFEKLVSIINKENKNGSVIYMSIAGGRKTMSSLMLLAGHITGIRYIYHFLVPEKYIGKNVRASKEAIQPIPIPVLHLDSLLSHFIKEMDEENRFENSVFGLIDQLKTEEAFSRLNDYLTRTSYHRKLREEYRDKFELYKSMMETTEMIVRSVLKGKLMFTPSYDRRVKEFRSITEKMERKKEEKKISFIDPFNDFTDIAGIRVVFYNSIDLEKAIKLMRKSTDFVNAHPKKKSKPIFADNRYKKYHYRATHFDVVLNPLKRLDLPEYNKLKDIPCEIQFKTIFAHSWSSVHHAIAYKTSTEEKMDRPLNEKMNKEFSNAAKHLEAIEQEINRLCNNYYKK